MNELKELKAELKELKEKKQRLTQKVGKIYYKHGRKTEEEKERYKKLKQIQKKNNERIDILKKKIEKRSGDTIQIKHDGISATKELINYHHKKFIELFNKKPYYMSKDYSMATIALKRLLQEYSIDDIKDFIDKYLELDDNFIVSTGYRLHFLPSRVASLITSDKKGTKTKLDFRGKDYGANTEDWQLFEYLISKEKGECTGEESWAKPLEKEIRRRELTYKDAVTYMKRKNNERS